MPFQDRIPVPNGEASLAKQTTNGYTKDYSTQLVENFMKSVQIISTSSSYQGLLGSTTSVSTLQRQVQVLSKENNLLKTEIDEAKSKHQKTCCEPAEANSNSLAKVEGERINLKGQLTVLKEEPLKVNEKGNDQQKVNAKTQQLIGDLKKSLTKIEAEKTTIGVELQKKIQKLTLFRSYTKGLHSNDVSTL